MKNFVKDILNEARQQRTIDPKIWASMSSASSKNRDNLGKDVKPRSTDDNNTLLQKYVAGLLTMKADCPTTEEDVSNVYPLIGQKALANGVTLGQIQKLYVENGGSYDGPIADDTPTEDPSDYPAYDDVVTDEPNAEEPSDYPAYDDVESENEPSYPTQGEIEDMDSQEDLPEDSIDNVFDVKKAIMGSARKLAMFKNGEKLCWDPSGTGFGHSGVKIGNTVSEAFKFADNKPRFMILTNKNVELGIPGNRGLFDDYYYKSKDQQGNKHMSVTPGSTYYYDEEQNGRSNTVALAKCGNKAANAALSYSLNNVVGATAAAVMDKLLYIPTLPELVEAIDMLPAGNYWTSSVKKNGSANIILQVSPDNVALTKNPSETASLVLFIKF